MEKLEKIININVKDKKKIDSYNKGKPKIIGNINRKSRIEELKKKINNDDYISEAINKLANSLTAGLMK